MLHNRLKLPQALQFIFLLALLALLFIPGCKKEDVLEVPGNKEPVGATAYGLLSDLQFKTLHVELIYMEDHAPTDASVDNMVDFLETYLRKPGGIHILENSIAAPGQENYSAQDIRNIEDAHRQLFNTENSLAISFIFLDGEYAGNEGGSQVLGIAYRNTSMAIFQETVIENSGGVTQPSRTKLESTIINHEIGHILGLVNNGTTMQTEHQDDANGHHCDNSDCLMYYTMETTDIVDNLIGNSIPDLGQNCQHDLSSNGGK